MILKEMLFYKEDIYSELEKINRVLAYRNLFLDLKIVGGAALIFNGISSVETQDIDTIERISSEIKEICDEFSLDINTDAMDYIENYADCEFIEDEYKTFSNIYITYLSLVDTIRTKLKNYQDEDKAEKLRYLLEDEFNVEMTVNGISEFIKEYGGEPDKHDIEEFLRYIEYI